MRNILLKRNTVYILGFGFCLLSIVPLTAWGQVIEFKPLVGIPGITDLSEETTLPQYFNAIYVLTISIAALIGVIKIAIAGVKYTMGDVVTNKASALQDIRGVLFGLALLLIPFIVLQTIYKDLTSLDVLKNVKEIRVGKQEPSATAKQQAQASSDSRLAQNLARDCAQKNLAFDLKCKQCVSKGTTPGQSCNANTTQTTPGKTTQVLSCSNMGIPQGSTCQSQCALLPSGTYSDTNKTCTITFDTPTQ